MKIKVIVEHAKYKITHEMSEDYDWDLFLRDYLEFFRNVLLSAGFNYVIDLAAVDETGVTPALEDKEYWKKKLEATK